MRVSSLEGLTDRDFAVPYAIAGWTAATVLALTVFLQNEGVAVGERSTLWFRVAGGWIALLMAALAWILVSEPIRLEARVEEATDKLRCSEARYRRLYDQAPLAYMRLDDEGRIQDVNDRFEEVMGHPSEQIVGRSIEELFASAPGDVFTGRLLGRFRQDGRVDGEEIAFETVDGEIRWVRLTMRSGELTDEGEADILAMAMDVTEQKWAETRLENYARELERSNEDLERFAHAASHDLREPLRMIKGYLGLLEKRFGDGLREEAGEFVDHATAGADRMDALITSLLEYSRVGTDSTTREQVDLEELWRGVAEDLSLRVARSGVSIEVGDLPTVQGDRAQLGRLLQNLVSNAIDHAGQDPQIRVDGEETSDGWVILVEDDGPGIPEDERDRIFDVFHRVDAHPDEEGTGIGLAICRRITDGHGGEIGVGDSELGGACVRVELPAEPPGGEVSVDREGAEIGPSVGSRPAGSV